MRKITWIEKAFELKKTTNESWDYVAKELSRMGYMTDHGTIITKESIIGRIGYEQKLKRRAEMMKKIEAKTNVRD